MSKKSKSKALAKEPPAGVEGSFSWLWWAALGLAVAALVLSLLPWTQAPAWLVQLDELTSNRTLNIDLELGYNPMGYGELATQLNGAFSQDVAVWLLGAAEAVWVAALTFIVLAVGGSIFKRPFDRLQLRRFLILGTIAIAIAAGFTLIFALVSGSLLEASLAEAPRNLAGYLSYAGGAEATAQGFDVTGWLWISCGLAIVSLIAGLIVTYTAVEEMD